MKWTWVKTPSANYLVQASHSRIMEAKVEINAHDKSPTLRRVKHPVTLSRLQELLFPKKKRCPHCDQEI